MKLKTINHKTIKMKKIYLLGLAGMFAFNLNAQQTKLKLNRNSLTETNSANQASKTGSVLQIASNIVCANQYTAGVSNTFNLTLSITNAGNEYGDSLNLTFPSGFTLTSAFPSDSLGVSEAPTTASSGCPTTAGGTKEPFRGIFGQSVIWGNNDDCWGGLPSGANAGSTMTLNVTATVGAGVTGPQVVNFHVSGDGFGTGPGNFSGTFTIQPAGAVIVDMRSKLTLPLTLTAFDMCNMGSDQVAVRVINSSSAAQSNFPVNYSVNGVAATATIIAGPLAPLDSVDVIFTTPYNFTPSNMYLVKGFVKQAGDISATNDTSSIAFSNSISVPLTSSNYTNGFETAYEQGSTNLDWLGSGLPFGLSGTAHTGTRALFYTVNMTTVGAPAGTYESFINLPCTDVTSGEIYRISYWRKSQTSGTLTINGTSAILTGTAQDAASMTTVLKAHSAIPTTSLTGLNGWVKDSVDYSATATETRYFGISGKGTLVTNADQINVRIDDIKITKLGTVGIKSNSSNEV